MALTLQITPEFLSRQECRVYQELFSLREKKGQVEHLPTRQRCQFDDSPLAQNLFKKWTSSPRRSVPFETVVDEFGRRWKLKGLNSHFRITHYDELGDFFGKHEDGFYWENWDTRSFATFMVYLNDVPKRTGGETHFCEHEVSVRPTLGSLCVFLVDDVVHEGLPLTQGQKFLLRTDVMYQMEDSCAQTSVLQKQLFLTYQRAVALETAGNDLEALGAWESFVELEARIKKCSSTTV